MAAAALLAAPVLYVTGSFGGAIQGGTPTKQIADGTSVSPTVEDDQEVDPEATLVPTDDDTAAPTSTKGPTTAPTAGSPGTGSGYTYRTGSGPLDPGHDPDEYEDDDQEADDETHEEADEDLDVNDEAAGHHHSAGDHHDGTACCHQCARGTLILGRLQHDGSARHQCGSGTLDSRSTPVGRVCYP